VPAALRLPAILLDARWTEWVPVTAYAIEHPEGAWLIDAGPSEATLDPEHFACDPGMRFVYVNRLRFTFHVEDRIDRRLAGLGVGLEPVRGVVFTHRHADHTDAIDALPDQPAHSSAPGTGRRTTGRCVPLAGRQAAGAGTRRGGRRGARLAPAARGAAAPLPDVPPAGARPAAVLRLATGRSTSLIEVEGSAATAR
jgi:glyoxylase-like metal-dependent hydrolase (beta-lactamase superfamily II)